MKLPEQKLWQDTKDALGGGWWARRVEDTLNSGLPDVAFTGRKRRWSWMELKVMPKLPPENGLKMFDIPHFNPYQRGFGLEAHRHGGQSAWWLLTRCDTVDHLHRATIIDLLGQVNYTTFRKKAAWVGRISTPNSAAGVLDLLFG